MTTGKSKKSRKPNPEYWALQLRLGCAECRFCDLEAYSFGPCCTYPHGAEIDADNSCVTKRLFSHA